MVAERGKSSRHVVKELRQLSLGWMGHRGTVPCIFLFSYTYIPSLEVFAIPGSHPYS
jgi:hypothetical protein